MVLQAVVDALAGVVGVGGMQTGAVVVLGAVALYVRRIIGVGSLLAGWLRSIAVVALSLALLLVTGIVQGVDLAALGSALGALWDVLTAPL